MLPFLGYWRSLQSSQSEVYTHQIGVSLLKHQFGGVPLRSFPTWKSSFWSDFFCQCHGVSSDSQRPCVQQRGTLPSLLAPSSHLLSYIRQYSAAIHKTVIANFFKSWWPGPPSQSVLVWRLPSNLTTVGGPAHIWNTGGIAFSITATCSRHNMTTDSWVVCFPDLKMNPGCGAESAKS